MSLPLFVERVHHDCEISAAAFVECDVLLEQVHVEDAGDTRHFLMMFVDSLASERIRYTEARARHDHAAAAECAAEMRDLTELAAACQQHLRSVGEVR